MLNPFSKHPEYLAALDRVKAWTRGRFKLPRDATVLVSEVACALPGCPPLEVRVQRRMLSGAGSPEATPSAKRSRRSTHRVRDGAARAPLQASVAPIAPAARRNSRRVTRSGMAMAGGFYRGGNDPSAP